MKTIDFKTLQKAQEESREEAKTISVCGLEIEVKQYLDIESKLKMLLESMMSTSDEISFDKHLFEISLKTKIAENYANIELPVSVLDGYNTIKETGILDEVLKAIPENEKEEINELKTLFIESEIEKTKTKNGITYTLKSIINTISENMPSGEQLQSLLSALGDE